MERENLTRLFRPPQNIIIAAWKRFACTTVLGSVLSVSAFAAELLNNVGFESGKDGWWSAYPVASGVSTSADILSCPTYPNAHLGCWYAYVGDKTTSSTHARGILRQDVVLPQGVTTVTLSFYLNITSAEGTSTAYDTMDAELHTYPGDVLIAHFGQWDNRNKDPGNNPQNYVLKTATVNVAAHAGEVAIFRFYGQTDDSSYTTFRIDDVSLQATVGETITTPASGLTGEPNPVQDTSYSYTVGTSTSSLGHTVEYSFDWGDGNSSSYSTSRTASHAWSTTGQKTIIVTARCQTHTGISNNNSPGNYVTVQPPSETISTPGSISGQANPVQGTSYSYTVGASTSSLGHTVEYSFDWGDGNSSSFSTSTTASHSWSSTGQKNIIVTARCQTHTSISNNNSPGKSVNVTSQTPAPVAGFSGDLQPVTGKLSTYNGGYSTGTGLSYSWTTTAGHASTASAPSFAFNSPGTYTISLTVTDSIGRTSSTSKTINVQAANNGTTPGQPVGADPVVLSAGNYVRERVDLRMPGKGFPFEFKRFYNSKFGDQTGLPLGYGWTHSYNERIKDNGTNALVIRGDGSAWMFSNSGGTYTAEQGVFDSLVTNSATGGWLLTDKNQMVKRFDSTGRLISITDKNGNTLTNIYVGGVLRQIQDTAGRTNFLNTNSFGCISDITDSIGRIIRFQYDSQTNLVAAVDANGQTNRFSYDTNHQLTDAFDAKGNCFVHNEYDTNNFTVARQHDAFTNWTFFYFSTNRITYQTNVMGNVSVHIFDERLLATNIVDEAGNQQSFAYDANRNRILLRDKRGNSTGYGYDARGNVTNKTDALNNSTAVEYNATNNPTRRIDALNHTTAFAYNASGNLTQTTNALNQVSLVDYSSSGLPLVFADANGHKTTNTFDVQGNLTKVQDALGNTTTFGYDGAGRKVAQTNANNKVTRYFYDNNDNLLRTVDPLGGTNTFIYDANNNRIVTINARGASTTNSLDSKDRLISVRDAMNGITSYEYDALDRKTKVTDARSGVTKFGYDAVGNTIAVTNALNQVTRFTYDANGNQTSIINPLNQTTTNIFDSLNRLVMTIDPLNHTNRTVYDSVGRRVQTIDALNRTNQFAYDLVGRLTQVTDAAGSTTKFFYDNVGNRLVTTDPNNHSTTNTLDVINRLVQTREPGGGVYQFAYDHVGNLTNQIDPKLQAIRYTYDGNNRKTGITYPSGAPVTFGYDANGNRTNMTDSLGTTIYQYDSLNRPVAVTDPFGKTVSCGYDANGNRSSLTYPGGKTVTYGYDGLNRMATVTDWLNGVTAYAYDAAGNLIHTTNPNASAVDYRFDPAHRLTALTNSDPNSAIISSYAYTLDAVGNHTQVNQTEQFQTLPVVGSFNYTYDNDNRMLTFEGQPETFDANGNMISINSTNLLSYDFENRLTQTALPASATNIYQYDGAGNRLTANRSGLVTRFVLDRGSPLTQVLAETDSGGTITACYVYGLGLISKLDANGSAHYYHFDSRGSTVALTDATGQITDAYAYDPFGRPRAEGGFTDNRFRYLGRHGVMIEEGSFYYIRARYYSTRRGRFISKDPTSGQDGDGQTLNRYAYALNNPARLIDISGLSSQEGVQASSGYSSSQSANSGAVYSLLQEFVIKLGAEGVKHANEEYLKDKMLDFLLTKGIAPTAAGQFVGKVFGKGVPIVELFKDMGEHYLDLRATVQDRTSLEDAIVWFTDLGATGVIGLSATIPFAGPFVATGLSTGYDTYHDNIINYVEHNPITDWYGQQIYGAFGGTSFGNWLGL